MGELPGGTSLEDVLGPAEHRYFGGGYRQVVHEVTERDGGLWNGRVTYPPLWSLGTGGAARHPHLSSVDALVLPLMALAQSRRHWASAARAEARCWVRHVKIRAGSEPWEQLANVPITLDRSTHSVEEQRLEWCSSRVGNMRVDTELVVAAGPRIAQGESICDLDYRDHVTSSVVELPEGPARELRSRHELATGRNVRSCVQASAVDFLVTMGQLAQALVYRAHATDRGGVENLWMRRMAITVRGSRPVTPGRFDAVTTLGGERTVTVGDRAVRTMRVRSVASVGVEGVADLAYFTERSQSNEVLT